MILQIVVTEMASPLPRDIIISLSISIELDSIECLLQLASIAIANESA